MEIEKVIKVRRVAKVVKGGRRFSFNASVVYGDGEGRVGYGLGKAGEIASAIKKGTNKAKKSMQQVATYKTSIPHVVIGKFGAGRVLLRPATPGTGVIASETARMIMEAIGIRDINIKILGTRNSHNVIKAILNGLEQLRSFEEVALLRGKDFKKVCRVLF